MLDLKKLEDIKCRYDLWWEHKNTEPIFYIIFPEKTVDYSKVQKDWMPGQSLDGWSNWKQELLIGAALENTLRTGEWKYVDDVLDLLEYYASVTGHMAEGFSFLLPGFGPGMVSACVSNFFKFTDVTVWFELPEPMSWNDLLKLTPEWKTPYTDLALETALRIVHRLKDLYIIAMPDMNLGLDVLSSLRGAQNLLMDTIECPENIHKALGTIETLWKRHYKMFSDIIHPNSHGCFTESMRYLSPKPMRISYCDFDAMISPDMFREFVKPSVEMECEMFDGRVTYHMDGPGQIAHLDELCSVKKLHSIQWVPGAGNAPCHDEKHFPLYRKIIDSGKKICFGGAEFDAEGIKKVFKTFPKKEFLLPFTLNSRKEAEEVMKWKKF